MPELKVTDPESLELFMKKHNLETLNHKAIAQCLMELYNKTN